ncbi:MAG: hemerythrin domain-containing protein [Chloroflexi bacterium]|nr:hemerythrin domain-containing protein [Chloroflexota bacterium]
MNATDVLRDEHEGIKRVLTVLEKETGALKAGREVPPRVFEDILEFITVFADSCHHGKEETALFPRLEEKGIPREGGPVGVMLMEHDEGRQYVQTFREGVALYKEGKPEGKQKIIEGGMGYANLLRAHIDKENNILFKLADRILPQPEQAELVERFERIEAEKIGQGTHERLHGLIDKLEQEVGTR